MSKSISFQIIEDVRESREARLKEKTIMSRHENLKVIVACELSHLKDLRKEQKTFIAIKKMEKLWPHHKWLKDNFVDASNIEVEI